MKAQIDKTLTIVENYIQQEITEGNKCCASSSFQTQSVPLLHLLSLHFSQVEILFLDTGYIFPETWNFKHRLQIELGLNVRELRSLSSYAQQIGPDGLPLYSTDTDQCCYINKVLPLRQYLNPGDMWISGIRADQTHHRAGLPIAEVDEHGVHKLHPMLHWTQSDIEQYITSHQLPRHPLTDQGYESIGCIPCTHRQTGSDARQARWEGSQKTECGLHT